MNNPFVVGKIVSKEHFCNRHSELASLCTDLPGGQNVVLYSPRRLGKSSLIRVALNEIGGKGAICAYVNLMALGSAQEMVEAVARAVTNAMVCSLGGIAKAFQKLTSTFRRVGVQFGIDPVTSGPVYSFTLRPEALEGDLDDIFSSLDRFAGQHKTRAVIALDEFQEILTLPDFGKRAEGTMRRITEGLSETAFVFSGSKHHLLKGMFIESARPFFRGAKLYELGPLPLDEAKAFLCSRFHAGRLDIPGEFCGEIARITNGHPYALQLMGSIMYNLGIQGGKIGEGLIRKALGITLDQLSLEYELLWDSLGRQPRARQLLRLLAHEGPRQRFSTKLLQRYNLPHSTVSVALKNLVKMGIVWPREMGGWSLVDPLLALWFKRPRGD